MQTGKPKIAIDLDDVTVDFCEGVRAAIQTEFGVDPPEFTDFKLGPFLDPIVGRPWFEWMQERDWIWKTFPAIQGAIGGIEQLRDEGYRLEAVTHKPKWAEATTWQWLGRWRPAFHSVVIVKPGLRKVDFTDAVLLVDDKPSNLIEFSDEGRKGVMYARPHNQSVDLRLLGIERVDNWQEVLKEVRRLTE